MADRQYTFLTPLKTGRFSLIASTVSGAIAGYLLGRIQDSALVPLDLVGAGVILAGLWLSCRMSRINLAYRQLEVEKRCSKAFHCGECGVSFLLASGAEGWTRSSEFDTAVPATRKEDLRS
jgi:hypothetical protein